MSSLLLNRPVILNNEGVALVETQRYEEAISSFTEALTMLKQGLLVEKPFEDSQETLMITDEDDEVTASSPPRRRASLCDPLIDNGATQRLAGRQMIEKSSSNDQPFLFSTPIRISGSQMSGSSHSYISMSFIVLFNLALSHHLSAIKLNMPHGNLNKALTLYELAYALQMREQIPLPIIYCMALVNNLGLIHKSMKHESSSRQCFEHLLATIMLIITSGQGTQFDHADGFLSNVTSLLLSVSAPAA